MVTKRGRTSTSLDLINFLHQRPFNKKLPIDLKWWKMWRKVIYVNRKWRPATILWKTVLCKSDEWVFEMLEVYLITFWWTSLVVYDMWIGGKNNQTCLPEGQMRNLSSAFGPIMTKYDLVEAKRMIFFINVPTNSIWTQLHFLVNQPWKFGK